MLLKYTIFRCKIFSLLDKFFLFLLSCFCQNNCHEKWENRIYIGHLYIVKGNIFHSIAISLRTALYQTLYNVIAPGVAWIMTSCCHIKTRVVMCLRHVSINTMNNEERILLHSQTNSQERDPHICVPLLAGAQPTTYWRLKYSSRENICAFYTDENLVS